MGKRRMNLLLIIIKEKYEMAKRRGKIIEGELLHELPLIKG